MKTLAVLSAFVTIALAAPTVEEYVDSSRLSPIDFTISQREKKSTSLETSPEKLSEHLEDHSTGKTLSDVEPSSSIARTFSKFKKPIIVKKKIGYHVYRDSEEEQSQLDPQENCRKEIKVKLCDDNAMDKSQVRGASSGHNHEEISQSEMEHSINIAKEAVQTFERDLHKMEFDCAQNHKHRQATLGSDAELHNDIEKARQAIEHIRWKFNNLDTDLTTADESRSKITLETAKSDEDRLAQWKDTVNLHKNTEIGRNLEENFKSTDNKDEPKHLTLNHFDTNKGLNDAGKDFKATLEDIDSLPTTNKVDHGMTTIVEDKNPKMEIQSDSLIKATSTDDGVQKIESSLSTMENQVELKEKNANLMEKQAKDNIDNKETLQLSDDSFVSKTQTRAKLEKEFEKKHLQTNVRHDNDQATHETNNADTILSSNINKSTRSEEFETVHEVNSSHSDKDKLVLEHDNPEKGKSLAKDTESTIVNQHQEHLRTENSKKENHQQMELLRSSHAKAMPKITELHNLKNEDAINVRNHMDNHVNNENIPVHLRASSDSHKEILNNMDHIDDSHLMNHHHLSLSETSHMMKNEKPELHERLNVPRIQPNSEHLKTMMQFSDNSHHESPHLKTASMFNNEQPNFNVQFNSPQEFEEQTNIQEFMPFKSAGDFHHNTGLDERFQTMHDMDDRPIELHDPLKNRWSHPEHMKMDGSSQHFNIEQLGPLRTSSMIDQHLSLNDQIRAQQRWAQAKNMNTHQLSSMDTGLEHMHAHDKFATRNNDHNLMMIEKANRDSTMQPSSFTQMRGAPKMSLEYGNPSQWAHNHGAFRSSYGPGMSASYGSGGGSAVGVFPNANVGNCAVPLLLSCSPSVVSGSLAKSQNSAPSYRSEALNFLKKRGVENNEASPGLMLQRQTSHGHKSNMMAEKNNETI